MRGRGRTAAGAGEVHGGAAGKRRERLEAGEGPEAGEGQGVAGQVRAPTAIQALAARLEHSQRKHLLCANPAPGSVRETGEPSTSMPWGISVDSRSCPGEELWSLLLMRKRRHRRCRFQVA